MVCMGTACVSTGAFEVKKVLEEEIVRRGLQDEIQVVPTGCNGFCERGPIIVHQPDDVFYQQIRVEDVPLLVEEHLLKGRPVKKLMYTPSKKKPPVPSMSDIDFFKHQRLVVLRNRGIIDPEKIDDYIANEGYVALGKVLTELTPEQVVEEVKKSGLRGRGGGGFPTGLKWQFCRWSPYTPKYILCNGDEGDPGAYMDRSLLEADPHAVLEGMAIGAYAIGASQGYVYIRDEYPLACQRMIIAIEQAREYGLLGEKILGTDFCFDLKVVRGAGAFVCGESSALMRSIEGEIGRPRVKYIHASDKGLYDKPTVLNNVETWANVPIILSRGADWYTKLGTEGSKGTKIFSLVGNVVNTGLVEVPMGITLRQIVFDIGGGVPGKKKGKKVQPKKFKAVQSGGPSGGSLPAQCLDLPIDYDRLDEAGSMMGSGGLIVMDEDTCMVDVAKYFLAFTADESCGKCVPCRVGTKAMLNILTDITEGRGKEGDIELLEEIGAQVKNLSLCGLGQSAPNPVLTTIRYFRDEMEAHVKEHSCPAGVCKALISYTIDAEKCNGCTLCSKRCPVGAISGERKKPHVIDQDLCTKCGVCYEVCRPEAVVCK